MWHCFENLTCCVHKFSPKVQGGFLLGCQCDRAAPPSRITFKRCLVLQVQVFRIHHDCVILRVSPSRHGLKIFVNESQLLDGMQRSCQDSRTHTQVSVPQQSAGEKMLHTFRFWAHTFQCLCLTWSPCNGIRSWPKTQDLRTNMMVKG